MGESKILKNFFEEQHRKWKKNALRSACRKYVHLEPGKTLNGKVKSNPGAGLFCYFPAKQNPKHALSSGQRLAIKQFMDRG